MGKKNKECTWSTCCVSLSELVSLVQLVKPPLIYVLRGHDKHGTQKPRGLVTGIPYKN